MAEPQANSYEILAKLSKGHAPAELFAARAKGVERLVVIKRLKREAAREAAIAQAFLAEARVAAKLAHPNIVQVYEVGKLGGSYFFTTEYVDGETLRSLITHARGKKIQVPIRAFLTIAAGAAAGLHHAHERNSIDGKSLNIVHAAISPNNVMISREGIVKVLDFGMARTPNATKLVYSSPEQVRGEKLDRRSDLFSLGVVLWELLTLGDLHARNNDEETRTAIEHYEPPAPSARRFDVPPELDAILLKLLAKSPAERYQTAGDLLAAIEALAVKLGFSLSTTDLARMMRLWFSTSNQGTEPEDLEAISVTSQDILAESPDGPDPVDELLATVREAATIIRGMAQRLGAATPRPDRVTTSSPIPTGSEHDATREDFAQIRDRILEDARKRKETRNPPLGGASTTPTTPTTSPTPVPLAAAPSEDAPKRKRHDTLNPANNPFAYITAVAETATAPVATITKGDAGAAMRALQATQAHVDNAAPSDGKSSDAKPDDGHATDSKAAEPAEAALLAANDEKAPASKVEAKPAPISEVAKTDAKAPVEAKPADKPVEVKKADASTPASTATTTDKLKSETKAAAKSEVSSTKNGTNGASKNGVHAKIVEDDRAGRVAIESEEDEARGGGWLMPAIVVIAAALVLVFVLKNRNHSKSPSGAGSGSAQVAVNTATGTSNGAAMGTGSAAGPNTMTAGSNVAPATGSSDVGSNTAMTAGSNGADTAGSNAAGSNAAGSNAAGANAAGANAAGANSTGSNAAANTNANAAVNAGSNGSNAAAGDKTNTGDKTNAADKTNAGDKTNTADKTNANTGDKSGTKTGDKSGAKTGDKTSNKSGAKTGDNASDDSSTDTAIEQLYARGDYAKTNTACAKNMIFTPERLKACALAACRTSNTALAKRWVNAISKSARPDVIAECKDLGLDLEPAAAPAPSTPAPSAPAPSAPAPSAPAPQ